VDALDEAAKETGKPFPGCAQLAARAADGATLIIGARNEEQLRQNLGAVGWKLTPAQIAKLDAASAVPLPYPYWHQRSTFLERNPPPV
jgi:aryl-alcohol dehydrogenase-like predicted oxidoreductase